MGLNQQEAAAAAPPAACALLSLHLPCAACSAVAAVACTVRLEPLLHHISSRHAPQASPIMPCPCAAAEEDLSAIVLLAHSVSMRLPIGAPISHAEALQHCKVRPRAGQRSAACAA